MRILTRIVIVVALVIVAIVTAMFLAGRDIPAPDTSDLVVERPVVAAEQNAYTFFLAVTNVFHAPTNTLLISDYLEGKPVDEGAVEQFITTNAAAMALIERGLAFRSCIVPEVTSYGALLPYLSPWKNMGRVMAMKTRHDRLAGHYVQATDTCISLLKFGDMIQADAGSIINYLVAIAIQGIGQAQAQDLARDKGLPPEELIRLLNALASPGPLIPGLVRAIKVEYGCSADTVDQIRDGKLGMGELMNLGGGDPPSLLKGKRIPSYFFQPNATKLIFANGYRQMIRDAPHCYADLQHTCVNTGWKYKQEGRTTFITRPNAVGKILYGLLVPALDLVLERKCRTETSLTATRLIVACNAYRNQQGKMPEDLQALVPTYLAAIPSDPYDGKAFRYVPSKEIVYSAGKDLKDSGGSNRVPGDDNGHSQDQRRWEAEDIVFEIEDTTSATPTAAVRLP